MEKIYQCEQCDKMVKIITDGEGELVCCNKPMKLLNAFQSSDEILNFAIAREEEAHSFYMQWANKLDKPWVKKVFEDLAQEEQRHKENLLHVKKGKTLAPSPSKVLDLKISDYLVDIAATPDMDYQKALIVAMKREKASFKLYSDCAAMIDDENLRSTFLALAQEEAKHKLRLETMYDKDVLTWD